MIGRTGRCRRGYTLVELVVVTAVVGMIGMTTMVIVTESHEAWARASSRKEVMSGASLFVERVIREVRQATENADPPGTPNITLADTDAIAFDSVWFRLNPVDSSQLQMSTDSGSSWQAIAYGVTGLTFSYYDSDNNALSGSFPLPSSRRELIRRVRVQIDLSHRGETIRLVSGGYIRNLIGVANEGS